MAMEAQNGFNNETNESLSDSEKVKKQYRDLREKIGKLDNCSYIDEEGYKVTLLSTTSKIDELGHKVAVLSKTSKMPEEYLNINISKCEKGIIVIKENMETGNCYITNVFYNHEYKRGMISWIQKSQDSKVRGFRHGNNSGPITINYDGETAGFQKSENLDGKDISPILGKIYSRYLDIILPTQKQKNQEKKLMLERVENTNNLNDADEFLDQALEDMA